MYMKAPITNDDKKALDIFNQCNGKKTMDQTARLMMKNGILTKNNGPISGPHICHFAKAYGLNWIVQKNRARKKPKTRIVLKKKELVQPKVEDKNAILELIISSNLDSRQKLGALKAIIQGEK